MHPRFLSLLSVVTIGILILGPVFEVSARGVRGGGGRGGARPSRPTTGSGTRPASRPARPSNLIDRSPAVSRVPSPVTRPAVATPRPARTPVRPRPVARPATPRRLVPATLRTGTPVARRTAARTRSRTALALPRPALTPAATNRIARRSALAANARVAIRPRTSVVFSRTWWNSRRHLWNRRWHHCHRHAWWYWWAWSEWRDVDEWVENDWDEPWEYEYDANIVFDEETVFINEEPVAVADDYIEMGRELTDIGEPGENDEIDWLSLGVFAMATSEDDKDPQMMIQLVLAKDGRVGGTYSHFRTENTQPVQGSLDKETQRIAFKIGIGENSKNVIEAGLESLTRDEAPLWVHFEKDNRTQTWTLIRLEAPPEAKSEMEKSKAAESGKEEKPS